MIALEICIPISEVAATVAVEKSSKVESYVRLCLHLQMMFLRAPPPSRSRYGHLNIPPTPGIPVRSGTVLGLLPEINENVNENDEVRQQTSTKAADIDEPQEATERLRICPVGSWAR